MSRVVARRVVIGAVSSLALHGGLLVAAWMTDAPQRSCFAYRARAAREARRRIEIFIREHAPAGSPTAFTNEQLRRLNATISSGERFEPYGPAAPPP